MSTQSTLINLISSSSSSSDDDGDDDAGDDLKHGATVFAVNVDDDDDDDDEDDANDDRLRALKRPRRRKRRSNKATSSVGIATPTTNTTTTTTASFAMSTFASSVASRLQEKPRSSSSNALSAMLWTDEFVVTQSSDLAVHAKKVADIRAWLARAWSGAGAAASVASARVLLLTGAPGTGKSATVRVLARELGAAVHEWHASAHVSKLTWKRDDPEALVGVGDDSALGPFERWLTAHASLKPLGGERANKLVLVDELPYLHGERERASFREILERYARIARYPLVVVLTDSVALRTRDLLPDERCATTISFNATPRTLMRKALLRVLALAGVALADERVDDIVEQCQGDVRHAVNTLQMMCVGEARAPPPVAASMGPPARRPAKRKKDAAPGASQAKAAAAAAPAPFVLTIGRDETVSLFRALGKVLMGKREDSSDKSASRPMSVMFLDGNARQQACNVDGRPPLAFDPEELVLLTNMDANTFALFLFENYAPYFDSPADEVRSVDSLAGAADWLSLSAQVGAVWNSEMHGDISNLYSASLAVRGIVHENYYPDAATAPPARTAFRPQHRPQWLSVGALRQTAAAALRAAAHVPAAAPLSAPAHRLLGDDEVALDRAPYLHRIVSYLPPLSHGNTARAFLAGAAVRAPSPLHVPADVRALLRALCSYSGGTSRAAALHQDELACEAEEDAEPLSSDSRARTAAAAGGRDDAVRVFEQWAGAARRALGGEAADGGVALTEEEVRQQIQLLSLDPILDD
jgi:cell cycle checkpoint protein